VRNAFKVATMLSAFADGTLFGERTGDEPVRLVALHGWRKNHADLSAVVDGFDAVALDLPGFGATPEPTEVWGAHDYAASVIRVLEQMPEPVVLFGHSFGGRVALCVAADRPDVVKALVLTGVPLIRRPGTAKPPLAFRLAKFANKVGLLSDRRMEQERQKRGSEDYRAATGLMRDIFVKLVNESYEAEMRQVKCPVTMVWGENDTAAGLWQAKEASGLFADSDLVVVPGGSHWLTNENPEPLREAIRKFVK
jgi:pimeloyl-ACP methyl ester carboxylesterase